MFPRGFTRDDMLSLALIGAREDPVLFGGSGNGETHTAIALGPLACGEGGKVAFWSTAEPVSELRRANKEGTAQDALRRLGRCGLMMDRIVHHGRLVTYDRESYRVKHALMRGEL